MVQFIVRGVSWCIGAVYLRKLHFFFHFLWSATFIRFTKIDFFHGNNNKVLRFFYPSHSGVRAVGRGFMVSTVMFFRKTNTTNQKRKSFKYPKNFDHTNLGTVNGRFLFHFRRTLYGSDLPSTGFPIKSVI